MLDLFRNFSLDDMFDSVFTAATSDLNSKIRSVGFVSRYNVDKTLSMLVDIPGVKESDLDVQVQDNVVFVQANRNDEVSSYVIQKSFTVPNGYDVESLKAELADGVLSLTFNPKAEVQKMPRKVEVSVKFLPQKSESDTSKP